jgi:hypothetical protein
MRVLEWIVFVAVFAVIASLVANLNLPTLVSSARHFLTEYGLLLLAASAVLVAVRVVSSPPRAH